MGGGRSPSYSVICALRYGFRQPRRATRLSRRVIGAADEREFVVTVMVAHAVCSSRPAARVEAGVRIDGSCRARES